MSLQVQHMAITAERSLLPAQAVRAWRIEEAEAARKQDRITSGRQTGLPSVSTLSHMGQMVLAMIALLRQLGA